MVDQSKVAEKLLQQLQEANADNAKATSLNVLYGILDNVAQGGAWPSPHLTLQVLLECGRSQDLVIPRNVSHTIGKCGALHERETYERRIR